jgi:acetyltransferase
MRTGAQPEHDSGLARATTHDGVDYHIRPFEVDDLHCSGAFLASLSLSSRCHRMLSSLADPDDGLLNQVSRLNYQRQMTLVAAAPDQSIIAVARYGGNPIYCEFAVAVSDEWQCRGVGTTLCESLFAYARSQGVRRVYTVVMAQNHSMSKLARALKMTLRPSLNDTAVQEAWRTL